MCMSLTEHKKFALWQGMYCTVGVMDSLHECVHECVLLCHSHCVHVHGGSWRDVHGASLH